MAMSDIVSRDELIAMYRNYPGALAQDVAFALAELSNDTDRVEHNVAVRRIVRLIPTAEMQRALWHNVAGAILETISQGVQRHGKD